MMNRLSFKIGLLFFVFILVIELVLFFILYTNLASDRIDEVMNSLLGRGNTHRDVLEDDFDESTLEHVKVMESASEFIVVITGDTGEVIRSSDPVDEEMQEIMHHSHNEEVPKKGKVLKRDWNEGNYVATDSPVTLHDTHHGHVFMFADASYVKRTVDQLSNQFWMISIITVVLTIVTIFILSRLITHPLIKMKEATEQLSKGKHDVALHTDRKDELGDLAHSITMLSKDLKDMKISRNEFLASISHELRTPLTYIKGYSDIMNRPGTSAEEMQEFAHIIGEETEQLTVLVKDLFQLAKMDENKFLITREHVNLCLFLQDIVELQQPILREKNKSLHVTCAEDVGAFIDPERFHQVLNNLLDNAEKNAGEGTNIFINVQQTNAHTKIQISDEGTGIPPEELPYIFDRLYRVEKSRSRESGGSGLGLAITKEIVERHDGKIDVQSEVNKGTTVEITLPRREQDA